MADEGSFWNLFNNLGLLSPEDQKAFRQYLERSGQELSQIPKDVGEMAKDFGPAVGQTLAGMLPGSGLVEGYKDFGAGGQALREGKYGEAAKDYAVGTGNTLLEMAPMAKAALPLGKTFLSILAGVGAKGAPLQDLKLAEQMEKSGMSKDQIWQAAGWERGKDDKWRFEIPDQDASLNLNTLNSMQNGLAFGTNMEHLLNHPQLYEAYPDIAKLPVKAESGSGAAYYGHSIGLGNNVKDPLSVLLHEAQHGVQGAEGFAAGSNPHYISGLWAANREKQIKEAGTHEENARLMEDYLNKMPDAYDAAVNTYMRAAGEVEARNVQARMGRDPLTNAKQRPELSEDRTRSEQVVPHYAGNKPQPKSFVDKVMGVK